MKKLICKIIGHKFKYNFVTYPTKCSCTRCGKKWKSIKNENYKGDITKEDIYIWVEEN